MMDEPISFGAFTEDEMFLERIADLARKSLQPKAIIVDPAKFSHMMGVTKKLLDTINEDESNIEVKFDIHYMGTSAFISFELDELVVRQTSKFGFALSSADNFEIYPLINGGLRFSMAFHSMLVNVY